MTDIAKLAGELIRARDVARLARTAPAAVALDVVDGHLRAALEFAGVRVLEATGGPLDDRIHEVLAVEPTDDPERDAVVAETVAAGYVLGPTLLRPQQVVVGRFDEGER